ncbi:MULTISPECIES: LysE family translocator [Thalassospira]|jgi:threonine/homoserine/homoserine lactone efflux protein|uniref:MFS transporter n=1 Tax=Thalassospira xiamenensis TaxID=220697 RepID=A0A367X4H3_9PROT|nr:MULTISPECIES: LysE family translocator [Thalassospira]KZB54337.1 MFS transporter [Thalassospira xiamenensis]MAZ35442.1 LysE family translocator [Thalassospira sp.]MBO9509087.1 LysE family translocator [Thalassospira sp. A3_1]MCH2274479.1 LysE family translocator [Thalassospira sp.]MCK2165708.1 LysE family translocator [Thalassospira xiamenensis]
MDWAQFISFTLVTALLVMSPGPNGVLIAKTVPTSGRAAGFANVAGFVTAFYLHGTLSILGISVILVQSAQLFMMVKIAGAAYLCWVGFKALREAWRGVKTVAEVAPAKRRRTLLVAYGEGFLTNALNPKVSIFYLAAFPQFIPVGEGAITSAFMLVCVHASINIIWFSTMIILLSRLTGMARNGSFQRALKAVTGSVFIAFGIKLAMFRP